MSLDQDIIGENIARVGRVKTPREAHVLQRKGAKEGAIIDSMKLRWRCRVTGLG